MQTSNVDIVNVQHAPSLLHCYDARPATEAQYEALREGVTSRDAVMEGNPAYQPLAGGDIASCIVSNNGE